MCETEHVSDTLLSHIVEQWMHESGFIKRYELVRGRYGVYLKQRINQTVVAHVEADHIEIPSHGSYAPNIVRQTRRINATDPEFFDTLKKILKACKYL